MLPVNIGRIRNRADQQENRCRDDTTKQYTLQPRKTSSFQIQIFFNCLGGQIPYQKRTYTPSDTPKRGKVALCRLREVGKERSLIHTFLLRFVAP